MKKVPHKETKVIFKEGMDETEYLLSSPANRLHLETALKNIENHTKLIEVPFESFIKMTFPDA